MAEVSDKAFRRVIPAASLKRGDFVDLADGPGFTFRRVIPAASLKHAIGVITTLPAVPFRRVIPAASLKLSAFRASSRIWAILSAG